MSKRFVVVGEASAPRVLELLAELLRLAPTLENAECLESIGEVAKLAAILAANHASRTPGRPVIDPVGLVDASGTAARLGVPISSVYRLVREGRLQAVRLSKGTLRFDPSDIKALVASRKLGKV